MAGGLSARIELIGAAVANVAVATAAAEAMDSHMRKSTATYLGGDLRMRNFRGGPVVFTPTVSVGRAVLKLSGGTYALADKGRRNARRRIYPRRGRRALGTPYGARRWVRGSTTQGFHITQRHGPQALAAGVEAARQMIITQAQAA